MTESPTPAEAEDPTAAALAEALSAEHAAVYGFEFVGGAAGDQPRRERASAAAYEHKALRDALHAAAVERGIDPPPALASYPLPEGRGGDDMDAFAAGLEETTMSACLWLSASADTDLRITAARILQEATVRALVWGSELDSLPGFDQA
ncbi:ferritin-like domain-containing protein [Nocardiopsis valliformis]|uniref:ferritin-like domain-containing protein n=1 Tax=Nocardiopsis valliformis TaxID=239974 RepID=UPI000348C0FA|nr:ferritin-like domain-containing protein [Nocardiopsis valliformis]